MENQRAIILLNLIGAFLVGLLIHLSTQSVFVAATIENPVIAGVVPASSLVGLLGGGIGFFLLNQNQKATSFLDSVVTELRKVSWPSREETFNNASVVVGATLFFSALLSLYDFTWAKLTALLLYQGG